MKKLIPILGLAFLLFSCDKVQHPVVPKTVAQGSSYVKNSNAAVADIKKVLIEDYTGQTCPNCPTGASVMKSLAIRYGDTLVPIAVHQGDDFAKPTGTYTNDFRTTAGEAWGGKSGSGFSIGFWPCGLINRKVYNNKGPQFANQSWPSIVSVALADPFVLKLNVNTEYDTTTRALNVVVKGKFKQAYAGAVKLIVCYQQDGIVGKQKDGGKDIEEYDFEHMMRGDIGGSWGTEFASAAAIGDSATYVNTGFPLPANIAYLDNQSRLTPVVDKQVSVIVFAYDATTRGVLQVEKVKIRP